MIYHATLSLYKVFAVKYCWLMNGVMALSTIATTNSENAEENA
jgi:hypothetical protein